MKKISFKNWMCALALVISHGSFAAESGKWELYAEEDGIKVYRMEIEGSPVVAFKGEGIIDANIAKVAAIFDDTSRKTEWIHNAVETKNIEVFSKMERIEYNHTRAPWPLKDRDFLFSGKIETDKAAGIMKIRIASVEDPRMPVSDQKVRGKILNSVYTFKVLDGGKKTHVTAEIHADPQGDIPTWVVNLFQKAWPMRTLKGIRTQVMKPDVIEDVDAKAFFLDAPKEVEVAPTPVASPSEVVPSPSPSAEAKPAAKPGKKNKK